MPWIWHCLVGTGTHHTPSSHHGILFQESGNLIVLKDRVKYTRKEALRNRSGMEPGAGGQGTEYTARGLSFPACVPPVVRASPWAGTSTFSTARIRLNCSRKTAWGSCHDRAWEHQRKNTQKSCGVLQTALAVFRPVRWTQAPWDSRCRQRGGAG